MNWVNTPDLPGSPSEPASMPKPVPIPVRQKLHERASRGESVTSLADEYGLSPRTVRHLLKRGREQGEAGLIPAYHAPKPPDHAHPEAVRQAALGLASRPPELGRRVDPRDARRGPTSDDRPQPPGDPTMDPGRRVGPGPARPAGRDGIHPGPRAASDLADRCLGAYPIGRQDRSLLAADPGRGHRGRLEDGRFPPSGVGPRSTRERLRPA